MFRCLGDRDVGEGGVVASRQSPVASRQSPVAGRQSPVASRQSPVASVVASRRSPVAGRRSPVAGRQSPVASRQSPVASRQSPVASRQSRHYGRDFGVLRQRKTGRAALRAQGWALGPSPLNETMACRERRLPAGHQRCEQPVSKTSRDNQPRTRPATGDRR